MTYQPRVLFINHSGQMGGAEHSLLEMLQELPVKAHVVLFSQGPLFNQLHGSNISVEILREAGNLTSLASETTLPARLHALWKIPRLLSRLVARARKFDVIYVNTKKSVFISILVAKFSKRPLIWHQRDAIQVPSTLPFRSRLSETIIIWILNYGADRIISVSQACADSFIRAGGKEDLPVIIHNGLDRFVDEHLLGNTITRHEYGLPRHIPLLCCVGRLTDGKGQSDFITSLTEIPDAHIVLIGAPLFGSPDTETRLKKHAKRLGVEQRVHFLGHRTNVPSLMHMMDIVVFPSFEFDSCPRVILEALHAGKPVVATRVGGVPELIEDGISGILVPPSNPTALASAICQLLKSKTMARRIARNGLHKAQELFTLDRVIRQVHREIINLSDRKRITGTDKVSILSPIPSGCGAFVLHRMLENEISGYKVLPYNPWLTLFPPLLWGLGRRQRTDLIHTTPDYAPFVTRKGKPLIITIHHTMHDPFISQYSSVLQRLHYSTDLKWFSQWGCKHADAITAVSHFSADLARSSLGIEKKIQVIYNGVDEQFFTPDHKSRKRDGSVVRVLFTGNISQRKGGHWLFPIAENLDNNIEIIYSSGLRGGAALPHHPKLKCVGRVPYQSLPDLYRQADIFLFPSVREGFGLAVAEAMACGLPIVTTDGSALPELVDHGLGGFLCPVGDVRSFSKSINSLAHSPSQRREMGQYNRSKVERYFTLDRMIQEYRDLFEKVMYSSVRS